MKVMNWFCLQWDSNTVPCDPVRKDNSLATQTLLAAYYTNSENRIYPMYSDRPEQTV